MSIRTVASCLSACLALSMLASPVIGGKNAPTAAPAAESAPLPFPAGEEAPPTREEIIAYLASLPPVPDKSLPIAEYEALGMPSLAGAWTAAEIHAAAGVLEKLSQDDSSRLPRHASPTSGGLFERLTAEGAGCGAVTDASQFFRMQMHAAIRMKARNELLHVYQAPLEGGRLFRDELGIVLAASIRDTGAVAECAVLDAKATGKTVPPGMRDGAVDIIEGGLQNLSVPVMHSAVSWRAVAEALRDESKHFVGLLTEAQRSRLAAHAAEVAQLQPDEKERIVLVELAATLSGAAAPVSPGN